MKTVCYGPVEHDPFRSIDLYDSEKSNAPLLVLVHGGAWRSEDKSDYRDLALGLTHLGSVASVNYRLSTDPTIKHPDHLLDIGQAIEYLYKTPNPSYNHEKIYLIGHSAGGHIATSLILDTCLPYHNYLAGIISISGIHDIPLLVKTFPSYLDFIQQAFGLDNHYEASPVSKQSSQLKGKPIIIAQSLQDTLINTEQANVMVQHLKAMGANVTLNTTITGDHYEIMNKQNLIPLIQALM